MLVKKNERDLDPDPEREKDKRNKEKRKQIGNVCCVSKRSSCLKREEEEEKKREDVPIPHLYTPLCLLTLGHGDSWCASPCHCPTL